ncbi:MAG: hypothetical protein U0R49_01005 [Fimbriimonadales bacterium]
MKYLIAILSAAVIMTGASLQQVSKNDKYGINPVMDRLAQIDKANQILPLLLTKDQIKQLLPKIERCRENIRNQEKKEADRIKVLGPDADKVYNETLKGIVPSQDFLSKTRSLFDQFAQERNGVKAANSIILIEAMDQIFDRGQKQRIIGVVDKVFNERSMKWESGTEGEKLSFFALNVLLDDDGYQFLVKLGAQ